MKKRTIATILISLAAAGLPAAAFGEYRRNFYVRMSEPTGFIEHYFEEHPDLRHEDFSCPSDKGPLLKGLILRPSEDPQALIVMTHGYNMTSEDYMPLAHRFTDAGFAVLMFDGLGIGMSEGNRIYGLPQHILDMDSVLTAVQEDPELGRLPLLLFGHSWGGYAACCISAFREYPIRGILTCAAFRKSLSSMIPTIQRRYPYAAPLFIKAVGAMERITFGKIASITSSEGLEAADCPARLYHSRDDAVIDFEDSFLRVRLELKGRDNVEFMTLDGRNHDLYLNPDNDRKRRAIKKELATARDSDLRKELTGRLWALMSETDEALADEFIEFYNACL